MKNIRLFRDKEAYKAIAPYLSYPHLSLVKDKDGTSQINYEFEEKLTATYRVTKEMIEAYPDGVPLTTNATRLIKSVKIKGVETVFEKPELTEGEGWKEIEWEMQDVIYDEDNISLFLPKPGEHLVDLFKFVKEKKKEDLLSITWKLERPLLESDWFLFNVAYNALEGKWYAMTLPPMVPALDLAINGLGSGLPFENVILYDESELTIKFHPGYVDFVFQAFENNPDISFPEVGEELMTFAICDGTWYYSEGQVSPEVKSYFKGDALVYTGGAPSEIKLPAGSAPGVYMVEYKFWEDVEEINGEELNSEALVSLDFNIKRDWKLNSYAFAMCENLEKVNLGNRIKYVGDYAFAGCPKIKEITLPSSIEGLGNNIFLDGLKGHLILECNCLRNNKRSFEITNFGLFDSILDGEYADEHDFSEFGDCVRINSSFANSEITEITIGEGIEFTGAYTFMNLKNLKKINFNTTTLTHIDVGAFWGSVNLLEEITIPDSVISIDGYAFFSYKGAKSYLDRLMESNGTDFSGCSITPKTITLGRGLKYLGRDSFLGNPGKLIVKSDIEINNVFNSTLSSLLSNLYNPSDSSMVFALSNFNIITDAIFEDGVKKIPDLMFYSSEIPVTLKNCTLPDSLEELGFGAFLGAHRLPRLDLPENLKRIQSYSLPPLLSQLSLGSDLEYLSCEQVLQNGENFSNVIFNEETGVISLDGWMLSVFLPELYISETDSTIELTLPNDCEKIPAGLVERMYSRYLRDTTENDSEFVEKRLKDLIVNIPDNIIIFNGVTGSCLEKEYNSLGLVDDAGSFNYKNLPHTIKFNVGENHSHFKTENDGRFLINTDTETLINGSFDVLSDSSSVVINIQEINIPDGIKHIESYAFSSYSINEDASSSCWRLATLISIPDSVESIGEYAFSGISFLDLKLPEKITVLREGTFYYDQALLDTIDLIVGDNKKEVVLPKNLVKLENLSLSLDRIQDQVIPETVKYVGFILPSTRRGGSPAASFLIKWGQLETVTILGGEEYLFSPKLGSGILDDYFGEFSYSSLENIHSHHIKLTNQYCSSPSIVMSLYLDNASYVGTLNNIYINKSHDYFLDGLRNVLVPGLSELKNVRDNYTILECLDIEIPGTIDNILPGPLFTSMSLSSNEPVDYGVMAEMLGSYSFQWAAKLRVADPITGEERPESIYERFSETRSFDMNLTEEPIAYEIKLEHSGFEKTFIYNQPSLLSESSISREEFFSDYIKAIVDFKEDDDRKVTFSSMGFIKIDDGEILFTGTVTPYTHEFDPGVHEIYFYRGLGSEGQNKNEILFEKIIISEGFYNIELNGSCNILEILGSSEHTIHNNKLTEIKEIHVESLEAWCNIDLVEPLNPECKVFVGSEELTSMSSIIIPSGVTHLRQNAFSGFLSITSLTLPDTVVNIDASAFSGCSNLSEINVPDNFAYSWDGQFDETAWYINQSEEPIVYLGENFYKIRKELISGNIVFSDKITSIPSSQFENCTELVSIEIPSSVKFIGSSAFDGCTGLTSIILNEGLKEIQDYSFRNTGISEITIPSSVKSIGSSVFSGCTGLTSIILNEGLEEILGYSFENTGISEITIPNSVKYFPSSNIVGTPWYTSQPDGFLYLGTRLIGLKGSSSSIEDTSIRENTTHVDRYPITSVTSITIPESVTCIGDEAFRYCRDLTSINIPESVVNIGAYAFWGCSNLTTINIPENSRLTSIEGWAFCGCGITLINIPVGVKSIGESAFQSCSNLTSINIPESVTSIGNHAFYNCDSIASINIPESVTSIGNSAFGDCRELTSITIPESVTSIGWGAFDYCYKLTSVYIKDIASWCNIDFGGNSTSNPLYFAENLYLNGEIVTELTIPEGVTSIRDRAFYNFNGITSITIPESVDWIGDYAIESIPMINLLSAELDYFGKNTFNSGSRIVIGPKCKAVEKIIRSFDSDTGTSSFKRDFRFIIDEQNPTYYYIGEGDIALVNKDTNSIIYWNNFEGDFYVPEEITTVNLNCGKFSDIQKINRSIYFSKNIRRVLLPQYYSSASVWEKTDLYFNDIIFVPFIDRNTNDYSPYIGDIYIPEELFPIFYKMGFYDLKFI